MGTARGTIVIDTADLSRASQAFTSVGKGLVGIGALAAAGFGLAVKSAADFEKSLSVVAAVLGEPRKALEGLRDLALDLGRKTKFSAQEVADGMGEMAKAGLTIDEMLHGATQGVVALAQAAGDMGLDQAAIIAVNAMKTFGLSAGDLTKVADSMAGAANASTLEVEDLAVSMRYAGATAHTAGLTIQEMNTALAILGDRGIRGSTAGTSLRGVLLGLTPTSQKAKDELKKLGLITEDGANKFFDATGKIKPMAEVMQLLQDATRGLSQEQKIQSFNTIFQRRAMASALTLADSGAKGFERYATAIGKVSAADVARAKLDNLAGDIRILQTSIQTALIEAGTPFQEQLRQWTQGLIHLVNGFGSLSPEMQKSIFQIIAYAGATFLALGTTSLIIGSIIKFVERVRQLGAAFLWIGKLTGGTLVKAFESFKFALFAVRYAIQTALIPALQSMAAWMLANPVVLIIAAIIALGVAIFVLYKKWKPFRKLVDATWQAIQKGWDIFLGFARDVLEPVGHAVAAFVGLFKRNWDIFLAIFLGPIGVMILIWRRFGDTILSVGAGIIDWFQQAPGRIINFITLLPGRVIGLFSAMFSAIYDAVSAGIGATVSFFAGLPEKIMFWLAFLIGRIIRWQVEWFKFWIGVGKGAIELVVEFFKALPGLAMGFLELLLNLLLAWGDLVVGFWTALPGRVLGFVNALWDGIYRIFTSMARATIDFVVAAFEAVVRFFVALPGRIVGAIVGLTKLVGDIFVKVGQAAWGFITDWFGKIVNFFREFPGKAVDAISEFAPKLATKIASAGTDAYQAIVGMGNRLIDFMKDLPGKMLAALGNVTTTFANKFQSIASSAWEGFKKGLFGSPKTKIQYALEDLVDYVRRDFNPIMGAEMAKLQSMTFDKLGGDPITVVHQVQQGVGIGAPTQQLQTAPFVPQPQPAGDTFLIQGVETMKAKEIAKEVVYVKKIRTHV